jgi:GR25 family glycosyltransferase involved in LPS biosynthesis
MYNSFNIGEIKVFVIAVDLVIRNTQLHSRLLEVFSDKQIFIIDAVKPDSITNIELQNKIKQNELLLGRVVTPTEVAISLSHKKCLELAFEMRASNALILEDDVDLGDPIEFRKLLENLNVSKKLKIWTFHSPGWSVWRKSKGKWVAVFPPAYATAYLLNTRGIEKIQKSQHIGLSDWPSWSKYFDFELVLNSTISVKDGFSYAEHERSHAILNKSKFKSLFAFHYCKKVSIYDRIRYIIIYPLIWKIVSTSRRMFTRNVYDKSAIYLGRKN